MTVLREQIGITPEAILAASPTRLINAGLGGIVPEQSVEKLRRSAEIALEHFGGDLRPILKQPLAEAKKSLKRFPAIGDPGAEKILLFGHAYPVLAPVERPASADTPGFRNRDTKLFRHVSLGSGRHPR